jgi:GntR family transcriptional regulator/MocR family aminotransferase
MILIIDRKSGIPIIRQIYNQIREKILCGELKSMEQLPSTRELSESLHVSRNVVIEAYELLEIEGFILIKPQSGTYVAKAASFLSLVNSTPNARTNNKESSLNEKYLDLRSGVPALDLIPIKKWNTYHSEITRNNPFSVFNYGTENGFYSLRNSICEYLLRMRGMTCNPEQLIITSGSLHSFSLLSHILCQENKNYIIEDPLHNEIKKVLAYAADHHYAVPVDESGMQTNLLPLDYNPAYIFVTPSHQYPLGVTLPIQRRIELIKYARVKNCYIIEDDYDSEYRYSGTPVSTLHSLDHNHVIYVGSFSKVLFPSVRIGYMILPLSLLDRVKNFVRYHDYFVDNMNQMTLTKMLENRDIDRHIYKMKKIYKKRRDFLVKTLIEAFGNEIEIYNKDTGLHLIVSFKNIIFTDELIEQYKKRGLLLYPVWHHSENKYYPKNTLIMGFSHLNQTEIESAITLLSKGPD